MEFSRTLREIRIRNGHAKARSFHSELIEKGVECNYAYYMKMESGQALPSPKLIEQISQCVSESDGNELILAYCRLIFPKKTHLFAGTIVPEETQSEKILLENERVEAHHRELNLRQINALSRSKQHYHLFLIATLARKPLKIDDLKTIFGTRSIHNTLSDLEAVQILKRTDDEVRTYFSEHKFPRANDFPELKPLYRQFDEWDESFAEDFEFGTLVEKMLIRRISPRYLNLIEQNLNLILDLVRGADEMDNKYNESLIQIRLSLKSGRLPG